MNKFLMAAVAFTFAASAAQAQTATSGSASAAQAGAQSAAGAASLSGVVINQNPQAAPRDADGVLLGSSGNPYTSELRNVPNVSAPAVFGGGHPCLAGRSGGFALVGGGLSYGQGEAEAACMAWVMGQPEVALRIMMKQSSIFCEAMNDVGYYRIGNKVVPAACGDKVVRGGVDSPGVASSTTKVKSSRSLPWAKCEYNAVEHKITFKDRVGGMSKAKAKAACVSYLGY